MKRPIFVGSRIYRMSSFTSPHPLAIQRVPAVIDLCQASGWLPKEQYRTSPRAKPQALYAYHTRAYVDALQKAETTQSVTIETRERHGLGTASNPIHPHMYQRPATSAGGVLLAVSSIMAGGTAYVPGGGTHHGLPDRANGFCYLNDPVLAIRSFQQHGLKRIAYVDIDAHHCDGVEFAFPDNDTVRLISIHEENRWPGTGKISDTASGSAFNCPVPRNLNDTEFEYLLEQLVLPAVTSNQPDAIVLQCGSDALLEDPLSRLALSNNSHWKTVKALHHLSPRFLVLGGGGYNPWSVARCWSGVWATLNNHEIPDALDPDARLVLERLTSNRKSEQNAPVEWTTTLRDPARPGKIRDDIRDRTRQLQRRLVAQL